MSYFEIFNKVLLELNYRAVAAFEDIYKNEHKKILNAINRVNDEVLSSYEWPFLLRQQLLGDDDIYTEGLNPFSVSFLGLNPAVELYKMPVLGMIKSIYLKNKRLSYYPNPENALSGQMPADCFSVLPGRMGNEPYIIILNKFRKSTPQVPQIPLNPVETPETIPQTPTEEEETPDVASQTPVNGENIPISTPVSDVAALSLSDTPEGQEIPGETPESTPENPENSGETQDNTPQSPFTEENPSGIVQKPNPQKDITVFYYSKNFACNASGEFIPEMAGPDDFSILPMPWAEHILLYGTCLKIKANPSFPKFGFWNTMYIQALANLRQKSPSIAENGPYLRIT